MIIVKKPKDVNGEQLAQELGIDDRKIVAIDDSLHIDLPEKDFQKINEIVKIHVPRPTKPLSIEEKFRAAGIDLNELKTALGL